MQEFVGYIFTTDLKLEKCLFLYGSGANGKSVFIDILGALLGSQNVANFSLGSLKAENNRAMLKDKLVNLSYEVNGDLDSDTFKNLISGEPIQARLLYGQSFMLINYGKFAFNANSLPKNAEHSEAFFRRHLIIPFEQTIQEDKRNPNLAKEIIKTELGGVLNWAIDGLTRILAQKRFSECKKSKEALDTYKKESNSVAMFIDEYGYKKSLNHKTLIKALFIHYQEFCKDGGHIALNIRDFSSRLKALGFTHYKSNGQNGFWIQRWII